MTGDSTKPEATIVANAAMLIRRPPAQVCEAFVDPAITTRFWFTRSSGRLEPGRSVRWDWEMYGVSTHVKTVAIEPGRRLLIEWDDDARRVEWTFSARAGDSTFVEVTESGFRGDRDAIVARALDSVGGFALVLAGAKAWLEHGLELGLVRDRFPDGVEH